MGVASLAACRAIASMLWHGHPAPIHVVCEWLGNCELIAEKHCLQVTEDHFTLAVQRAAKSAAATSAEVRNEPQMGKAAHEKTGVLPPIASVSTGCEYLPNSQATPLGFEPRPREPKSLVLPLHYGVMKTPIVIKHAIIIAAWAVV